MYNTSNESYKYDYTHMSIIVLAVVDVNYASYTVYERSFKGESFVVTKSKNTI